MSPVGETRSVPVDVRVVAATHRNLAALVADGSFREDLLARLAGYELLLPPLRERREDLGTLVRELLASCHPGPAPPIDLAAARALLAHDWPRNVRELSQALRSAVALSAGQRILSEHLPAALRRKPAPSEPAAPREPVDPIEVAIRDKLVDALRTHNGNVAADAPDLAAR